MAVMRSVPVISFGLSLALVACGSSGGSSSDAPGGGDDAPAGDGGGGGGDAASGVVGFVGSYADLNLAAHPVYSIDMAIADYGIHYNGIEVGTGTSTHHATGWWDGGAYSRMTPPTVDGLERGIAIDDLWRGATLEIRELNLRFEWRGSATLPSRWGSGTKFLITHAREAMTIGDAQTRPMLFARPIDAADDPSYNRADTFAFAPAQGTTQAWGGEGYLDTYPPLRYNPDTAQVMYIADEDDLGTGTFVGRPLVAASEVFTFELRLISVATAEYPRGLIGLRIYRRNGDVYERSAPWNIDADEDLGDYISDIQQLGCGEYNTAPTPNPDLYMDVGGYLTVAHDYHGWLGPRAGFVQ